MAPQRSRAAYEGLGVQFEGDHDEGAAHGDACGEGLLGVAELAVKVAAKDLRFGVGLLKGPAALGIGALENGEVTVGEGLKIGRQTLSDVEGDAVLGIAVGTRRRGSRSSRWGRRCGIQRLP